MIDEMNLCCLVALNSSSASGTCYRISGIVTLSYTIINTNGQTIRSFSFSMLQGKGSNTIFKFHIAVNTIDFRIAQLYGKNKLLLHISIRTGNSF